jgi:hypothetical protein
MILMLFIISVTVNALCSTPLVLGESNDINVVHHLSHRISLLSPNTSGVQHKAFTVTEMMNNINIITLS